ISQLYTFTFTYNGTKALPEDLQLFNFDMKTAEKYTNFIPNDWYTMTASTIDQSNVETKDVYAYMESYKVKNTYSKIDGALKLEGTIDPVTGQQNYALDQSVIGAKVTVTSYDGKTTVQPSFNKSGQYSAEGLKADTKPYTYKVDVPGHFTMNRQ